MKLEMFMERPRIIEAVQLSALNAEELCREFKLEGATIEADGIRQAPAAGGEPVLVPWGTWVSRNVFGMVTVYTAEEFQVLWQALPQQLQAQLRAAGNGGPRIITLPPGTKVPRPDGPGFRPGGR
jgi:hypothetical protein